MFTLHRSLRAVTKLAHSFKRQAFSTSQPVVPGGQNTSPLSQGDQIPVHLRPYNKEKYEVLSSKIKYATGYALLDVEPFPRGKIMKLCYIILDKLKEIPEKALYRVYTEEKIKYYMKLTDEIEDIKVLEEEFGFDSIEVFIQGLHGEVELVDQMKVSKPWEPREENVEFLHFARQKREDLKHQHRERPEREKAKFLAGGAVSGAEKK